MEYHWLTRYNVFFIDRQRIDISKLAQWEVVFEHADRMGMLLHFKTQEKENDQLLDGGQLWLERKLYYRELIARFGHHLALQWNLGEGNTNTNAEQQAYVRFFNEIDPYNHPIVIHADYESQSQVFDSLLHNDCLQGVSLQSKPMEIFKNTLDWVEKSKYAHGQRWVVTSDEQLPSSRGLVPDSIDPALDKFRKHALWGNLMAGGAGIEYFFGYNYVNSDLTCQDFRTREAMWNQSRYALEFFEGIPFWSMTNTDHLVSGNNHALADASLGTVVVFLRRGGPALVDLSEVSPISNAPYMMHWYDPRNGGDLHGGLLVYAGEVIDTGNPPTETSSDWVVLLEAV